jgi:hypothetical protein
VPSIVLPGQRQNQSSKRPKSLFGPMAGGLRPALLLLSCFKSFSLSLQSTWHISIALLVPHRSHHVYRCSHRDTPGNQATRPSSPTQEDAARAGTPKVLLRANFSRGNFSLSLCLMVSLFKPKTRHKVRLVTSRNLKPCPRATKPRIVARGRRPRTRVNGQQSSPMPARGKAKKAYLGSPGAYSRDRRGLSTFRFSHFTRRY